MDNIKQEITMKDLKKIEEIENTRCRVQPMVAKVYSEVG